LPRAEIICIVQYVLLLDLLAINKVLSNNCVS